MGLSSKALYDQFVHDIELKWGSEESEKIAQIVFNHLFGLSRIDIFLNKSIALFEERLIPISKRLLKGEPVQYILNQASFYGLPFFVNPFVLYIFAKIDKSCIVIKSFSPLTFLLIFKDLFIYNKAFLKSFKSL